MDDSGDHARIRAQASRSPVAAYKCGCACQARSQLSFRAETCYAVVMPPSPSPVPTVCLQACEWTSAVSVRDGPCLTAKEPLRRSSGSAHPLSAFRPQHIQTSSFHRGERFHHHATNSHKQARFSNTVTSYPHYHIRNPREMIPSVRTSSIEPILCRIGKPCDSWPVASTAALQHSWSHLPTFFLCDVARLTSSPEHDPRFAPTSRRRSTSRTYMVYTSSRQPGYIR